MYYSLVESHISYGISLWGNTYQYLTKPIYIQQKKSIRTVFKKGYNYPTYDLFKNNGILNVKNLHRHSLGKLMYRWNCGLLPCSLSDIFDYNSTVHKYYTRNHNNPHMYVCKSSKLLNSFLLEGPKLWISLPKTEKSCKNLNI